MVNICSTISNDFVHTDEIRITVDIIKTYIKKLKRHEDDGKHGFKSDHLIHGSNRMFVILCLMFNSMLTHGYTPMFYYYQPLYLFQRIIGALCVVVITIVVFHCLIVCVNYLIMFFPELNADSLKTDDMQLGFKGNHSTVLCSVIYIETINNNVNDGSDVYSCLSDASKAFDRVHWGKLFKILIERNVSTLFIRLLLDS